MVTQKHTRTLARLGGLFSRSPKIPSHRKTSGLRSQLSVEHLEDRRMLSVCFVDADAVAGGDGQSWAGAYQDLQAALDYAETANSDDAGENDVDQIWIAEGEYRPSEELESGDARSVTFVLVDGLTLHGGFAGTESSLAERDGAAHVTTLSGDIGTAGDNSDNAYTVVYCERGVISALEGLTISKGNANGTYEETVFHPRSDGGGVFNRGTLEIVNCSLLGNSADGCGGAVMNDAFEGAATLAIANSVVCGNVTDYGGALYSSAYEGEGFLSITNCTVVENRSVRRGNAATAINLFLHNSIVCLNGEEQITCHESYSGSNNLIGIDPGFVRYPSSGADGVWGTGDDDYGDLRLASNRSPAIDGGDIGAVPADILDLDADGDEEEPVSVDRDGNARAIGDSIDIGAYEFTDLAAPDRESPSTIVTADNDVFDFYDGTISLREAIYYATNGTFDPVVTFDASLDNGTIILDGRNLYIDTSVAVDASALDGLTIDADGRSRHFCVLGMEECELRMIGLTLTGGVSVFGGSVWTHYGTVTVEDSAFIGNQVVAESCHGGALYNSYGNISVTDSLFQDNHVVGETWTSGGAIYSHGSLVMTNSTVLNNSVRGRYSSGGGIYSNRTLTLVNSTICGNSVLENNGTGGGLLAAGTVEITNCTIALNAAYSSGGFSSGWTSTSLTMNNTIVAGNRCAGSDPDVWLKFESVSGGNNLIGDGSDDDSEQGVFVDGVDGNIVGTAEDPIDPLFTSISRDDGIWSYALLPDSPAIDAGSNEAAVDAQDQPLSEDVDGNPRIQNTTVDIGSVENALVATPGQTYVVTSLDDVIDATDGELTFAEAFKAANSNAPVGEAPAGSANEEDVIQLAEGLSGAIRLDGQALDVAGLLRIDGPGADLLAIDAEGQSGVFSVQPFANLVLDGVTVTGGADERGGGISNEFGTLTILSCEVSGNEAVQGGGVYNHGGTVNLVNTRFATNRALDQGGGVYNCFGALNATGAVFVANAATGESDETEGGGGICNEEGSMSILNSTIAANFASGSGGGIWSVSRYGEITLHNSVVARNESGYGGADIYLPSNSPTSSWSCHNNLVGTKEGQSRVQDGRDGNLVGTAILPTDPGFTQDPAPGADGEWGTADDDLGDLAPARDSILINLGGATLLSPDTFDLDSDGLVDEPVPVDVAGNARVQNALLDIGAYETGFEELILYVNHAAYHGGNGFAWDNAFTELQEALDLAAACNSDSIIINDIYEIWVAEGTYFPPEHWSSTGWGDYFLLADGITVCGGFDGTESEFSQRDVDAHRTILSGDLGEPGDYSDNSRTVVFCPEGAAATLDGLTITGGNAEYAYFDSGDPDDYPYANGGGIFNRGDLTVANCVVEGNRADRDGGGIYCHVAQYMRPSLTVVNSAIQGNTAGNRGGGLYEAWETDILNTTFSGNTAKTGGAFHGKPDTIINCTITHNPITSPGQIEYNGGTEIVANSIFFDNECGDAYHFGDAQTSNNLVGIDPGFVRNPSSGEDGVWGTADDDYGDLRIAGGRSPAVDAGNDDFVPTDTLDMDHDSDTMEVLPLDLGDSPRTVGSSVDIGAYEFEGEADPGRETPSTHVTAGHDIFDLYDGQITLREAILYATSADAGTTITFDSSLNKGTILLGGNAIYIDDSLSIDASNLDSLTLDVAGDSRVLIVEGSGDTQVECTGLTLTGGRAYQGGGVYAVTASLTLNDCRLTDNYATQGGGIYVGNRGSLSLIDCELLQNEAIDYGGAVYVDGTGRKTTARIVQSTIWGNHAHTGGGIFNEYATLILSNSLLVRNTAYKGAAIGNGRGYSSSQFIVTNCTISENVAEGYVGGIYGNQPDTVINNTLIAGNLSAQQPYRCDISVDPADVSGANNLIGVGWLQCPLQDGVDGNIAGTEQTPVNPLLGEWTQLENGSWGYGLLPGSPALDAGDDTLALDPDGTPLTEDILGSSRIEGAAVDIGAFEGGTPGTPAQTYIVTSLANVIDPEDGELTLIEALEAANRNRSIGNAPAGSFSEADVIQFAEGVEGTVLLGGTPLEIMNDLVLQGPGADSLVFDAQGQSRVLDIQAGISARLEGIGITGGDAVRGAGILHLFGSLSLDGCTVSNSTATSIGAGIYSAFGELTLADTTISGNAAALNGGGLHILSGTATVSNALFSDNKAIGTGSASDRYGRGGAVYVGYLTSQRPAVLIRGSSFEGNQATDGAGVFSYLADVSISDSSFRQNFATSKGTIYNEGTMTLTNSLLAGNQADMGGGIYNAETLDIENSTIAANQAVRGGGIWAHRTEIKMQLRNSIIAGNSATIAGPDLYGIEGSGSGENCLIGDGSDQTYVGDGRGNVVGTAEAPIDPRFVRNPSDGGDGWGDDPDTPDNDESANDDYGDLRLRPDSPALDAGRNDVLPQDTFDLDGDSDVDEPIPFDLAGAERVIGGVVDMGAYETLYGDLSGDGVVNTADLDLVRANWGQTVTPGDLLAGDASGDGVVDGDDLNLVRANWGYGTPSAAAVDAVLAADPEPASNAFSPMSPAAYGPRRPDGHPTQQGPDRSRKDIAAAALENWLRECSRFRYRDRA